MKFGGKRRQEPDAPDEPAAPGSVAGSAPPPASDSWSPPVAESHMPAAPHDEPVAYDDEPVVEGEAVELPVEHVPAPSYEPQVSPRTGRAQPASERMPFPVADEPVAVVTPGPEPAPVTSLGDSAEAYASGHAAAPGPSWQEPVMQIANERPELVVAAAFAGGVLAALILRRLGS
jgi:hypothetical protein